MTPARPRLWRIATVVPTVLLTAAGVTVAVTSTAPPAPSLRTVSFQDGSPFGKLGRNSIRPGGLRVTGWAIDPDSVRTPVSVWGRIDGSPVTSTAIAGVSRKDVAATYPSAGGAHGFAWRVPVPEGTHTVCVAARNLGPRGTNTRLGCLTKTFDYGPTGHLDAVTPAKGSLRVTGWALDADAATTSLNTIVKIDGTSHPLLANAARSDVATAHPGAGAAHGFDATYPVAQGTHTVCVTAANVGFGTDNSLGCVKTVLDERPVAALDSVGTQAGKLHVRGWSFDPDAPTTPGKVLVKLDNAAPVTVLADDARTDVAAAHPNAGRYHGFDVSLPAGEGSHRVCVTAVNVSYGTNRALACRTVTLAFTPTATLTALRPRTTGVYADGWTVDPDTSDPIKARITVDGVTAQTVTAGNQGTSAIGHQGHQFSTFVPLTSGRHSVCAIGLNVLAGTHNSAPSCRTVTLALSPLGTYTSLTRGPGSDDLAVTGWAFDPDSTGPSTVAVTLDGKPAGTIRAAATNATVATSYPRFGAAHGIADTVATDDGEHTVCLTVRNVSGGKDLPLGCKTVNAVHPVAPGAPGGVHAVAGFGGATVTWVQPASDGGAPVSSYTVTASPGGRSVTVSGASATASVTGLASRTTYSFTVTATNVAGTSLGAVSSPVTTPTGPPAQRTPAPVSTSRYIRNAVNASPSELAMMRREGATDGADNPSGHGYLVLLDIGGQDQYDGGVVLSAGIRFVSYRDLVKDINAYVDGYHSTQRSNAPVTIALGTNNDMTVNATSGAAWADSVVDPVRAYAKRYVGMTIAGANDIEPGFRASYASTKAWLSGYLGATSAQFINNGSADGCSWTTTGSRCNNGWTMAGLQYLAGGAAPTRILNLPQIYNTAMAGQWKYISLTGVVKGTPRINFAGPLTELTACRQAGGCGSMSGRSAWTELWNRLQSDNRLKVSSLPYSTDLRIDR